MSTTQLSKIQLRRGLEETLPGAPSTLTPLVFTPNLAQSELCFTTDTGRIFIGDNPPTTAINYRRITFPYQNIEVLTERSSVTLNKMLSSYNKSIGVDSFLMSTLVPAGSWTDVPLYIDGMASTLLFTPAAMNVSIDFQAFTSTNTPHSQGIIWIMNQGGAGEPQVIVDYLDFRRIDVPTIDQYTADIVVGALQFKGNKIFGSNPNITLQYKNALTTNIKFYFKIKQVKP